MIPPGLFRFYESRAVAIRDLRRSARRHFGREAIHDLRVEIKRLHALFELVEACNPLFESRKQFRPFRNLFRAAGPLREAQVDLALARHWVAALDLKLDEYRSEMTAVEVRSRRAFAAAASSFHPGVLLERQESLALALAPFGPGPLRSLIEEFLWAQASRLLSLKDAASLDQLALHRIRIQAKKTRYVLEILRASSARERACWQTLNDALRAVHQPLGLWHDDQMGLGSLRAFCETSAVRPLREESSYAAYARALRQDQTLRLADFEKAWAQLELHDGLRREELDRKGRRCRPMLRSGGDSRAPEEAPRTRLSGRGLGSRTGTPGPKSGLDRNR